jgi:SAM-dependent methyltransferase
MSAVIWHDLECGGYVEDLALWRSLADEQGDPVLDVGAGTGRVALALARQGHRVTALDADQRLLDELRRRADGLEVDAVCADARDFQLDGRFALCLVPMQTIQLLDGRDGRMAFLRCAREHLDSGGLLAIAIAEMLELYEVDGQIEAPLPDICELDGVVYSSQPTAVRVDGGRFILERRRETVSTAGERSVSEDVVVLDRVSCAQLEREAVEAGLRPAGRTTVPPTRDYVGSEVVMLRA